MPNTPTAEQAAWLKAHQNYVRTSHIRVRCQLRGTLMPDGSFVAEGPGTPVIDGGGSFGVGIPMPMRR
jgi:hypothetical protein